MYAVIKHYNDLGMTFREARAYRRTESGTLEITQVSLAPETGKPMDSLCDPIKSDGTVENLTGWPDERAESFDGGNLLVGLKR